MLEQQVSPRKSVGFLFTLQFYKIKLLGRRKIYAGLIKLTRHQGLQ